VSFALPGCHQTFSVETIFIQVRVRGKQQLFKVWTMIGVIYDHHVYNIHENNMTIN
jgi:hypothetical protein